MLRLNNEEIYQRMKWAGLSRVHLTERVTVTDLLCLCARLKLFVRHFKGLNRILKVFSQLHTKQKPKSRMSRGSESDVTLVCVRDGFLPSVKVFSMTSTNYPTRD